MIRTAADLKAARKRLGWSLSTLARALRMTAQPDADRPYAQSAKRLREIEDGRRELSGPVAVAVEAFLTGFRPEGFADPDDREAD